MSNAKCQTVVAVAPAKLESYDHAVIVGEDEIMYYKVRSGKKPFWLAPSCGSQPGSRTKTFERLNLSYVMRDLDPECGLKRRCAFLEED